MSHIAKILLLGSGELGKEFVISAKRLGACVIAVDSYANAPAMQVADAFEVIDMLDGDVLQAIVDQHQPDYIVPEIEAIRTEKLLEIEKAGFNIVPTARATYLTMNRDAIRDLAADKLQLRTARYAYAESIGALEDAVHQIGLPCVIKPVMSSSGKGQSTIKSIGEIALAWQAARDGMRGDKPKVIVEEFIQFESEITLLTVKQRHADTLFVKPIGHRQEGGDYRESWLPANISADKLLQAEQMAKKITDELGGVGIFGVEFFITKDEVVFSELSPRPHDTGMVTMVSQDLSEFDLHVRAILGLPIPQIDYCGPSASAVILSERAGEKVSYQGIEKALSFPQTRVRIFGKPNARVNRRMGVALAKADTVAEAVNKAKQAAACVEVVVS